MEGRDRRAAGPPTIHGGAVSTVRRLSALPTVPDGPELVSLRETAARVVRARHAGGDGEDLIQEAWLRVALALRDRPVDNPHAYAAGVAANLVRGHHRTYRRRQGRVARLWTRPTDEAPDSEVLRDEESAALVTALGRLPDPARDVLVAHIVHGLDTGTLAARGGTTPGAVAACLARARAMLRVEYVIAFRRLPEPPDLCRRICYAVSANDARREVRLDAAGHLQECATCRSIAAALRERRRPAMGAPILIRLSSWGTRLAQFEWTGSRMGVAGGLVGVGVVGALALGGALRGGPQGGPGALRSAASAPAAVAPAPARLAGRWAASDRLAGGSRAAGGSPRGSAPTGDPASPVWMGPSVPTVPLNPGEPDVTSTAGTALPAMPAATSVSATGPVTASATLPSGSFRPSATAPQVSASGTPAGGASVWVYGRSAQVAIPRLR